MKSTVACLAALLIATSIADAGVAHLAYVVSPPPSTRGLMPNNLPSIPPEDRDFDAPRRARAQPLTAHKMAKSSRKPARRAKKLASRSRTARHWHVKQRRHARQATPQALPRHARPPKGAHQMKRNRNR
jgi:hypothetical protein